MGRKIFQIAFIIIVILAFAKAITDYLTKLISDPNEFEFYISNAPNGQISRIATLTFNFAQDFDKEEFEINEPVNFDLIHFSPRINGTFYWIDKRTLEFLPKNPLPSNSEFFYRINLNKIFKSSEKINLFRNKFHTPEISFNVSFSDLQYGDSNHFKANGDIAFTDQIDFQTIHQIINIKQGNQKLPIRIKQGDQALSYQFIVDNIERKTFIDTLSITWKTNADLNDSLKIKVPIPALNSFQVLNTTINYDNKTTVTVSFSNPINKSYSNDSLIAIIGALTDSSYASINQFHIILSDSSKTDKIALNIKPNFSDIYGNNINEAYFTKLYLNNNKPELESVYKQFITALPSQPIAIPFKSKNINKVDVNIFEITEQNALQFLQLTKNNNLNEVLRVGKKIHSSTVNLAHLNNFKPEILTNYKLNFQNIAPKKGSIIHYQISYNESYLNKSINDSSVVKQDTITQNIIYTNINAIAKTTPTDTLLIQVFNVKNKEVLRNANVEVFDFQQHKLSEIQTNKKGSAQIRFTGKIAFVKISYLEDVLYINLLNENEKPKQQFSYLNPFFFSNQTNYQNNDSLIIGLIIDGQTQFQNYPQNLKFELINPDKQTIFSNIKPYFANEILLFKYKLENKNTNGNYLCHFTLNDHSFYHTIKVNNPTLAKKYCSSDDVPIYDSIEIASNNFDLHRTPEIFNSKSVNLTIDSSYNINDTLAFTLPLEINEYAFISIENKSQILFSKWFASKQGFINFKQAIDKNMWSSANVNINIFDEHGPLKNIKKTFKVNDSSKSITPVIISKFDLESNSYESIRIKEKQGHPMQYLIVLSPTDDISVLNPFSFFNQITASNIQTFGGYPDQILLEEKPNISLIPTINLAQNKHFFGPFYLAQDEIKLHELKIPNTIGKAKLSVMCTGTSNTQYGYIEKSININKNILVQYQKPEYIQPNELIQIKALIFIENPLSKTAKIDLRNPINCSFTNNTSFQIPLNNTNKPYEITLSIKANEVCELASFLLSIEDSTQQYEQTIEIPIISLNPSSLVFKQMKIEGNENWQTRITPQGIKGSNFGNIEFSNTASVFFNYFINRIKSTPYKDIRTDLALCMAIINMKNIAQLSNAESMRNDEMINNTIKEISTYMYMDGSFRIPLLNNEPNTSFNLFAGHFLIHASKSGYQVNERILKNWIRHLQFDVQFTDFTNEQVQVDLAKKLYILTLVDKTDFQIMKALYEEPKLSSTTLNYLALSYAASGKIKLAKNIKSSINDNDSSDISMQSISFELNRLLENNTLLLEQLTQIFDNITTNENLTIYHISHCLFYASNYLSATQNNNKTNISYRLNKGKDITINSNSSINSHAIPIEFTLPKTVDIFNNNKNDIYTNISLSGIPKVVSQKNLNNQLSLTIEYYDSTGNKFKPTNLKLDQCFQSEVTLSNQSKTNFEELILVFPYATGWEYVSNGLTYYHARLIKQANNLNKLIFSIRLDANSTIKIPLNFNAKFPGNFYLAPIRLINQNTDQTLIQLKHDYCNVE